MSLKTPRRLLVGFSLLAVTAIGGFLAEESRRVYLRELSVIERNLESQATLLAEHAQLTFSAANQLLADVDWLEERHDTLVNQSLYHTILTTPQFAALIVLDPAGQPLYTARKFSIPTRDFVDQDFFQAHREGAFLLLSAPLTVGDGQRRLIPLSQRLTDDDGSFAGVAMVLLDTRYFQHFYTSVSGELDLRIGMFHRDGTALALYPEPLADASTAREPLRELFARRQAETLVHETPVDGTQRISAYRNLEEGMPAVVTASYHHQALMSGLYPTFLRNGLIFLAFAISTAGACMMVIRTTQEAYRAREAQLEFQRQQHETLRLCHAIARNLPNGRVFVLDRERRYVFVEGQLWQEDHALKPEHMVGKTISDVYPKEISGALTELVESAFAGNETNREVPFQGRVYQAHATPLTDDDGTIWRCLLLSQDITQFKQDQRKLEALNHQLQRLAASDGLLGIANRREFERVLEREWQRACRSGEPLGLLMADVDYFKLYNDTYGHLDGDECLKQVARVLEDAAQRPTDLVARYGGEEMVLLLPGTDLEGALHVAGRIQALLARQAIPFPESSAADHVTVSIGAASTRPTHSITPDTLVEQADQALYRAKENGRNTAVPAGDIS